MWSSSCVSSRRVASFEREEWFVEIRFKFNYHISDDIECERINAMRVVSQYNLSRERREMLHLILVLVQLPKFSALELNTHPKFESKTAKSFSLNPPSSMLSLSVDDAEMLRLEKARKCLMPNTQCKGESNIEMCEREWEREFTISSRNANSRGKKQPKSKLLSQMNRIVKLFHAWNLFADPPLSALCCHTPIVLQCDYVSLHISHLPSHCMKAELFHSFSRKWNFSVKVEFGGVWICRCESVN